jgi:hypothetical protein
VARSAEEVLVKKLILNEPPRRFAAPRLNQGGELCYSLPLDVVQKTQHQRSSALGERLLESLEDLREENEII